MSHPADRILELARREASLEHAHEFAAITKGPVFAAASLALLAPLLVICMVWRIAVRLAVRLGGGTSK